MAQLEAERSALKMRSTSAEEQLAELLGAMASNILRYQKEILRLRQQLHERGGGGGGGAGGGAARSSSPRWRGLSVEIKSDCLAVRTRLSGICPSSSPQRRTDP